MTRARTSAAAMPSCSGPNATSSKTVALNSCTSGFWKTMPTRRLKPCANSSLPKRASVSASP